MSCLQCGSTGWIIDTVFEPPLAYGYRYPYAMGDPRVRWRTWGTDLPGTNFFGCDRQVRCPEGCAEGAS